MAYYDDLTPYEYMESMFYRPMTSNVGWLSSAHAFATGGPTEALLAQLWNYCKVSVAWTRGLHRCEFCNDATRPELAERNGERLLLGTAEIRVFDGLKIYAAPTLIYHYVDNHNYLPPSDFVRSLIDGVGPPDHAYFRRLGELALEWKPTSSWDESTTRFRVERGPDGKLRKIDV